MLSLLLPFDTSQKTLRGSDGIKNALGFYQRS